MLLWHTVYLRPELGSSKRINCSILHWLHPLTGLWRVQLLNPEYLNVHAKPTGMSFVSPVGTAALKRQKRHTHCTYSSQMTTPMKRWLRSASIYAKHCIKERKRQHSNHRQSALDLLNSLNVFHLSANRPWANTPTHQQFSASYWHLNNDMLVLKRNFHSCKTPLNTLPICVLFNWAPISARTHWSELRFHNVLSLTLRITFLKERFYKRWI